MADAATRQDPTAGPLLPLALRLDAQRRTLALEWPDSRVQVIPVPVLRAACRCAECTRDRRQGREPGIAAELELVELKPCGPGAVNLHFSDGHVRGIFPFAYLATVGAEPRPQPDPANA